MRGWHFDHHAGPGGHGGFRMERGDLRYMILDLLAAKSSYGYELMRGLEDRFHGFYTPSAGTVYPTLQWLEDLAYVSASEADGRKMYTITDEGRRFLEEHDAKVGEVWGRMGAWWGAGPGVAREAREEWRQMGREMHDFGREMRDLFKGFRRDAGHPSPEKLHRIRDVIRHAAQQIEEILKETDATGSTTTDV